jgi:hypothetical protein
MESESPKEAWSVDVARYLRVRRGLPRFRRRLEEGPVTVGYLGGSLTMMKEGWRPLFHQWLNERYPRNEPHRALHVGRGGVGSASGAFFVQDEICGRAPDLVFVEYAINDSYDFLTPPALRQPAIEGIIRSIRLRHPDCDVCLVYMHHVLRGEAIGRVIEENEALAEHYGLPSIHVGQCLQDQVDGGTWSFRGEAGLPALLRDECHPLPPGNRLITELMGAALTTLMEIGGTEAPGLPPALSDRPMVGGRVIPVDAGMIRGGFERETRKVGNFAGPVTWFSLPEGSQLCVRPPGVLFGLFVVVGPRSGVVRMEENGRRTEVSLLDRWCSYERISTCILAMDFVPGSKPDGDVWIELSPDLPDYTACPKLEVIPKERRLDVIALFVL